MKIKSLLCFGILVLSCSENSVINNSKLKFKNRISKKINLPIELQQLNHLIYNQIPEISYTVINPYLDSIYLLDIYNSDSNLVGEFSIMPVSLSKEKNDEYEYWAFRTSCIIGILNPKNIRFKNYVIRPKCGFNNSKDKNLMTKFHFQIEKNK